ncbi:UvrD-helicase domain-containing protein [Flavobacterium sp. Fl-77]|uniref:UvrD-helicase domain-containing protein n=1 Tax=Flavobacterium flavipigmentatum TaxID=2893884 RepID=A0AAJ2VZQ2_9FLAO|nr:MULTISPECIES: UvrD-helicase domain-containing protein [unclassified Flavobacterium]MDX6180625.1 UvrD-helicase domain-containing protein [Flavobacterium sp. Fl-33]MDX6184225.1 UvrD-helicase domain-containing protein [Flavobacterium sp. Fl-77]UFH39337.1 UvrD-helicase domain-containing protein [Flavobacterium sp. F-70]
MKEQLKAWLKSEQNNLDLIIAKSAVSFYKQNKEKSNFQYDLKQCHIESYNLIRGKDLCYDRPSTAFAYSLWYHPRRVNTFLSFFLDKILDHNEQHLQLFDLGAGAGAIQWGLGLIYVGLLRLGKKPPKITVINIDTSPFMLTYNRDFLWAEFVKSYPEIDENFIVEYEVNSWNNEKKLETSNPILSASYLFDASDNKNEIANDFKSLVQKYKPKTVLLLTSNQPEKRPFIQELEKEFKQQGFNSQVVLESNLMFSNQLTNINNVRNKLSVSLNVSELQRPSYWRDSSHYGLILQNPQSEITFSSGPNKISSIDIFNPPITVRKDVILNDKQKRAARNSDLPSVIVGPAGCGKSIVITEKVKNIIEENKYNPDLKILITTFNKGLIGKLAEWLISILDSTKYQIKYDTNFHGYNDKSSHFTFNNSQQTNIRLLHFDMLPKLLGGIRYKGLVEHSKHFSLLDEIIKEVRMEEKINNDQYDNILNHDFLFEEYHRVIYGLQVGVAKGENTYLTIKRKGRGNNPSMPKNSYRRQLAWKCLTEYANKMHVLSLQSFTLRRQYFYSKLKSKELNIKYDHILVDEFQDCTDADFEIFYMMIKDPNNFTISGDLAQSIHLGTAANIPRDENMDRRQFYRLEGSYRLPVRISESIKKLSEAIVHRFGNNEGAISITPYKGSPPGARPIVVYGNSILELSEKVLEVFKTYNIYDLSRITILEKDLELLRELALKGVVTETDTILSLKGLEKECVLWSTRIPLEFEKEKFEFAYTIVTRTSCILIIALTEDTQNVYKEILGLLDRERLIFWDKLSETKFDTFCEEYELITIEDED